MEKLIIYTPCSRPQNLRKMQESIFNACHGKDYKWLICFDEDDNNNVNPHLSRLRIMFNHKDPRSTSGNAQRNKCIDYASENYDGSAWMYCLDDDNIIHPDLFKKLEGLEDDVDMVIFQQIYANGKLRSSANEIIGVGQNDSANFAVRLRAIGDVRWELDKYEADGIFAKDVSENAKNIKHIHTPLCYYNYLDPNRRR